MRTFFFDWFGFGPFRIQLSWQRAKILRDFQYNLLSDDAKRELATRLSAHVLVLVPMKFVENAKVYFDDRNRDTNVKFEAETKGSWYHRT